MNKKDEMQIDWKPELDQTRAALLDAQVTIEKLRAEAENWKAVADRLAGMVVGRAGALLPAAKNNHE